MVSKGELHLGCCVDLSRGSVRKVVIAGNWKMHMTCAEARRYIDDFLPRIQNVPSEREVVLAPPFTALSTVCTATGDSRVLISSQNVHWDDNGAFTGEISAPMLHEHGVSYTIVGHSEPRKYYSEPDEVINHRARGAQAHGLIPILCVGESNSQREENLTEQVIRRQVEQGIEGVDVTNLVIAYEPIWAIGTGKTCACEEANRICELIRRWVGSDDITILYGGSVKPGNIDEIMAQTHINGVLVGGASLDPVGFARIANYQPLAATAI